MEVASLFACLPLKECGHFVYLQGENKIFPACQLSLVRIGGTLMTPPGIRKYEYVLTGGEDTEKA